MNQSKKHYNDVYIPHDGAGAGRLAIAGKDTVLKLVTGDSPKGMDRGFRDHHGTLNDGSKASLLACLPTGFTSYGWGERAQHETSLLPRYVLIGDSFIGSDEPRIKAVHYHFENVGRLVNGLQTFGIIHLEPREFRELLEAEYRRRETIAQEHRWDGPRPVTDVGDAPVLQYYSGARQIVNCAARIGSVALTNRVSHGLGGPHGTAIDNEVTASLEFVAPTTVDEAFASLSTLHSFFELCLGRRQRYLWIELELVKEEPDLDDPIPSSLEGYWSYGNERVSGETPPTYYGDVLVDAGTHGAQFARILSGWLDSAPSMRDARSRIASSFLSGSYGVDRIVGSANAFDLLPDTHVPSRVEPDAQTREAVKECRDRFKALPESFARQSVLSALGRVGKPSLRDKICHRAEIVARADPERFSELHLPCTQAVLCRNHFVHGSEGAFDYWEQYGAFAFLADTLEFVFVASDLIELGWDYNAWRDKGSSLSHGFGSYVVDYGMNHRTLKQLIGA